MSVKSIFEKNMLEHFGVNVPPKIAIAVSGGVDSVVLAIIAAEFARKNNIEIHFINVNHNMRDQSVLEQKYVGEIADKLNAKFAPLNWDGRGVKSNFQGKARLARYDIMSDYCVKNNINSLLTAHHQDDKIETYLLKKDRQAGIFGLASNNEYFHNNVRIFRPMHNIFKQDIINYAKNNSIKWFEDSSNNDQKYKRNALRINLKSFDESYKLDILKEIEAIDIKAHEIARKMQDAMAEDLEISPLGFAKFKFKEHLNSEYEVLVRTFEHIIAMIGGRDGVARYRNIKNILDAIRDVIKLNSLERNLIHFTLMGVKVVVDNEHAFFYREATKIQEGTSTINSQQILWDNRFKILIPTSLSDCNINISRLSLEDWKEIKLTNEYQQFVEKNRLIDHKYVLFSLPIIKRDKKILALPGILHYDISNIKLIFSPKYISRFIHY